MEILKPNENGYDYNQVCEAINDAISKLIDATNLREDDLIVEMKPDLFHFLAKQNEIVCEVSTLTKPRNSIFGVSIKINWELNDCLIVRQKTFAEKLEEMEHLGNN